MNINKTIYKNISLDEAEKAVLKAEIEKCMSTKDAGSHAVVSLIVRQMDTAFQEGIKEGKMSEIEKIRRTEFR